MSRVLSGGQTRGPIGFPNFLLYIIIIKGMSTSVRFQLIIVDCALLIVIVDCPTRVSGGFLLSCAWAHSFLFLFTMIVVSIWSRRDCDILPVRCSIASFCTILYVLMLCLVLFYILACLLSIGDVQHRPLRGVNLYSRVHVYMFYALCLHSCRLACFGCIELQCACWWLCESCVI